MRIRALLRCSPRFCWSPRPAHATTGARRRPSRQIGSVDFGGQFSTTNGDEARYQRYKDLRSGGLLDAFRYTRAKDKWQFDVTARHVGYRDQKFLAQFRTYERPRSPSSGIRSRSSTASRHRSVRPASATPYTGVGSCEYRLDDAVQQRCRRSARPARLHVAAIGAAAGTAVQPGRSRGAVARDQDARDIALLDATSGLLPHAALLLHFQNTGKTGLQPWFASYGFSGP